MVSICLFKSLRNVTRSCVSDVASCERKLCDRKFYVLVCSCYRKSQHCEVEKKRRERMNRYMSELAQMIPACNAVPRRLDKLSILKMTVDHMKGLRGDPHSSLEYKPGFLTDEELKQLLVEVCVY